MAFDQEWVDLHTTPSIFGRFLVHTWRQCGGLSKEHSIQVCFGMQRGAKISSALNELK